MSNPAKDEEIGLRVHEAVTELNASLREAHQNGLQINAELIESRCLKDGVDLPLVVVYLMRPIKLRVKSDSPTKVKLDENLLVPRRR
jgi:hypothetical protein